MNKIITEQAYVIGNKECTEFLGYEDSGEIRSGESNKITSAFNYSSKAYAKSVINNLESWEGNSDLRFIYPVTITYEIRT